MKQIIITVISLLIYCSNISSQNSVDNILTEIEENNTELAALRKMIDAEKIGNKTAKYLQNPEFEFNYLWGNPSDIGTRTDIHIRQSFDFPTVYGHRNKIADARNEQLELDYIKQLKEVLLQSRKVCIDIVYLNVLISELSIRLSHTQSISKAIKSNYEAGESNIMDYNKSQLNQLNISKELETSIIERDALLAELACLNGGVGLALDELVFQDPMIPADFDQWYTKAEQSNPVLSWLKEEIEISQKEVKLNTAKSLPGFHAGYMSEKVVGSKYQGLSVGITIPLWENKNRVKFAKAHTSAVQSMEAASKQRFYSDLKALHSKAIELQKNVDDYRSLLTSYDNTGFLKKALDNGEINLVTYYMELSVYYESIDNMYELERYLHKTIAELNQYL